MRKISTETLLYSEKCKEYVWMSFHILLKQKQNLSNLSFLFSFHKNFFDITINQVKSTPATNRIIQNLHLWMNNQKHFPFICVFGSKIPPHFHTHTHSFVLPSVRVLSIHYYSVSPFRINIIRKILWWGKWLLPLRKTWMKYFCIIS